MEYEITDAPQPGEHDHEELFEARHPHYPTPAATPPARGRDRAVAIPEQEELS